MPSKLNVEAREIAFARASGTRESRFAPIAESFVDFEVGETLILTDEDLALYRDEAPYIVSQCADGASLTKVQKGIMRNMRSALERETQKAHGDGAKVVGQYLMLTDADGADVPAYGVKRVA